MRCKWKISEEKSNRNVKKWHQKVGQNYVRQAHILSRTAGIPNLPVPVTSAQDGCEQASHLLLVSKPACSMHPTRLSLWVQMTHLLSWDQLTGQNLWLLQALWLMYIPLRLWIHGLSQFYAAWKDGSFLLLWKAVSEENQFVSFGFLLSWALFPQLRISCN